MDKICVTEFGLRQAENALENFSSVSQGLTENCCMDLRELLKNIDDEFIKKINNYLDEIRNFNTIIRDFCSKNISAIEERKRKMLQYSYDEYK